MVYQNKKILFNWVPQFARLFARFVGYNTSELIFLVISALNNQSETPNKFSVTQEKSKKLF